MQQDRPIDSSAAGAPGARVARWWRPESDGKLLCYLCPRYCRIGEGQSGFCYIRGNVGGTLRSLAYAQPCAVQVDPIEKKPLFHFLPGSRILSLGTAGCNMACKFCQNWEISKSREDQVRSRHLEPADAVGLSGRSGCPAIAFTYNEPTIWAEYAIDISVEAHRRGIATVMVTNGYITPEALPDVYRFIDAANVDLKAFSDGFYRKTTLSRIAPVLETLKALRERGVWVEITNLLIPTLNDDEDEIRALASWVLDNMGADQPLHFTAFHPDFKLTDLPATSHETVHEARRIALAQGLRYVYEGNVLCEEGGTTFCPGCRAAVITRSWHRVSMNRLDNGTCRCGTTIAGRFAPSA